MNFEEITISVVEELRKLNIQYMLTGALAVNYHGKPRMTHDIDIVVMITIDDIQKIRELFEKNFFVDEYSISSALEEVSMFNIVHKETGFKVDFWILKSDEYSQESFERRKWYPYQGTEICLATPEDMIITKLEWYKMSDIDKHYFDALGIYRVQKGELGMEYISKWCERKSIGELWEELKKEGES
jgi:hypothetical protein